MTITGIGNGGSSVYESTYKAQKNETAGSAESKAAVSSQKERAQNTQDSGEKTVSDYYSYLRNNYDCMSKNNVTISGEYLKKCAGNSQKAKELETFLKKIPKLEKQGYEQLSARNKALGGTVTFYQQTWTINKDGSIQSTVYSVTETGMTNAERMKKSMDERLEKQKEKKEEAEKAEERKAEQAEWPDVDTENISEPETAGREIIIRHVQAKSESEAEELMRKEKPEDVYCPEFDRNI